MTIGDTLNAIYWKLFSLVNSIFDCYNDFSMIFF